MLNLAAFSVAPKILEALTIAETYMEKTEKFDGKVRYPRSIFAFMYEISILWQGTTLYIWLDLLYTQSLLCLIWGLHHSKEGEETECKSWRTQWRTAHVCSVSEVLLHYFHYCENEYIFYLDCCFINDLHFQIWRIPPIPLRTACKEPLFGVWNFWQGNLNTATYFILFLLSCMGQTISFLY